MKRTPEYPYRAKEAEIKANCNRTYDKYVLKPSKINPIFTEKPHYGLEVKK